MRIRRTTAVVLFMIAILSYLTPPSIFGQASDNGGLTGRVTDPNGAVVPGATVTIVNLGTNATRSLTTNDEGRWTIAVLPLGNYEVTAEGAGFQRVKQTAAVVASVTGTVDLTLGVGQISTDDVTVTATTEGSLVNAESATTSSQVTGQRLEELPVATRSAYGLLANDTSVSSELTDPLTAGNGNPEVSVHGSRTTSQAVIFNGVDATNFSGTGALTENSSPALETVQEVKLLSSLYDASLGRSGGGSIQLVTKSGTNQFSGSAYLYAQNEYFNANDFFFNRDNIDRQKARRLEGGFTVGGPIIKDRFFFFGGYQKTDAITAYVPTAQSLVVLPEALAFITDRSNPENVRQAFNRSARQGGATNIFNLPSCVRNLANNFSAVPLTCIDPNGIGFRLLNTRNPVTNDFFIPSLRPGYERLFVNTRGRLTQEDLNRLGLPDGIPLVDIATSSGVQGGVPLVRQRNVVPAEFQQDQFTTRLNYDLLRGNSGGGNFNTLSGTFFFANYPGYDPFSDDSLASPTPLVKNDRSRTLAITDTHVFSTSLINEARFGYFFLDNSRQLDSRFLEGGLTSPDFGFVNPAAEFAPGPETLRLPRFAGVRNLRDFSLGAPNDIFNQREQVTMTFADNLTYTRGEHSLRAGVEYKRNYFDTSLPEEQGGEFEGLRSFLSVLTTVVPEVDTAFGITNKQFRFNDLSFYASDDWRVGTRLTLNLGVRWDWYGRPFEKNGLFANYDFSRITDPNDIRPGFILPNNTGTTGFNAIDASLPTINRVNNRHTLNGEDLNNFAPRVGFALKPFKSGNTVLRGGYGIFYDRPSAAFINTIYANYPFLREIESTNLFNPRAVLPVRALSEQDPNLPFSDYFPFRIAFTQVSSSTAYYLFDNTPGVRSTTGINDELTGRRPTGNLVEPIEFRAIDRDLKTPLVQQWNLSLQQQLGKNWAVDLTYVGTRGQNLLLAVGFNQPYDLNDPDTPEHIYKRLNDVYARTPRARSEPLRSGVSERERGRGIAYGDCNLAFVFLPGGFTPCVNENYTSDGRAGFDYNIDPFSEGRDLIAANLRVPYLGFDPQDAIILQSRGYSTYHSGQINLSRRFSNSFGFNVSYTFSKSIDIGSTDPGSTTASGRPDTPNLGLVVQGDQRNINNNRAVSDFDRPHRFASSFAWELPRFGSKSPFLTGWQLSGFGQWQSGTPFSVIASDPEFLPTSSGGILTFQNQYRGIVPEITGRNLPAGGIVRIGGLNFNAGTGTGSLYQAAFARPNVTDLNLLRRQQGDDPTREYFNICQEPGNAECALSAAFGGFGNLGRNILRGPTQKRIDLSLQKNTRLSERVSLELKWDVFNVMNFVNFANPNFDMSDETDFGQITRTVGAPRVMQFGAKVRF